MSAQEISYEAASPTTTPAFHVVRDGEISASFRRRAFAHSVARTQRTVAARTYAALGSMAAAFTAAAVTIVWAFLAIPNTPLP